MTGRRLTSKVLTWRASIAESGLPRTTRAVAWALANYMNERGESAFPGVPLLSADVGNEKGDGPASKTTVIAALRQLQDAGYLVRAARGGGRSKRGEWHARLPETVQQLNPLPVETGVPSGPSAEDASEAQAAANETRDERSSLAERVQQLDSFPTTERVQSQHERVQSGLVNGSATAPEVEVLEVDQEVEQQQPRARELDEAAAAGLLLRLEELKIPAAERALALADPERATAWLDLAASEARRNPAGLFRTGFASGDWPSPRIAPARPTKSRFEERMERVAQLVKDGDVDPDEIRYFIEVDWHELADVERSELHQHLAELLSGAPARPKLRAVDAA